MTLYLRCDLFMHKLLPVCIEWVWSNSVPKGPWLRYPCHVTPKDSQRSGSEGTEGPQMELHRLALLRPSAVISPYTYLQPSHDLTPRGARRVYSPHTRTRRTIHRNTHTERISKWGHLFDSDSKEFKCRSSKCVHGDPLGRIESKEREQVVRSLDSTASLSLFHNVKPLALCQS